MATRSRSRQAADAFTYQTFSTSLSHPRLEVQLAMTVFPGDVPDSWYLPESAFRAAGEVFDPDNAIRHPRPGSLPEHLAATLHPLAANELLGQLVHGDERELPEAYEDDPDAYYADLLKFCEHAVFHPHIPLAHSPVQGHSLAELATAASSAGTVGGGAILGWLAGGGAAEVNPILMLTVPVGIVLCGAARGLARGLDEGLREWVMQQIRPEKSDESPGMVPPLAVGEWTVDPEPEPHPLRGVSVQSVLADVGQPEDDASKLRGELSGKDPLRIAEVLMDLIEGVPKNRPPTEIDVLMAIRKAHPEMMPGRQVRIAPLLLKAILAGRFGWSLPPRHDDSAEGPAGARPPS